MTISKEAQEVLKHYEELGLKELYGSEERIAQMAEERKQVQRTCLPYQAPGFVGKQVDITPSVVPAIRMPFYVLTPKGGAKNKVTIIYIHGGGFIQEINHGQWSWAISLCKRFSCTVYVPIYHTGPTYSWQQTYSGLMDLYCMVEEKRNWRGLVLAGDSCGATFCQALSCYAEQQGITQPAAILYYFGLFDLRFGGPEAERIAETDPFLSCAVDPVPYWAPDADLNAFPPNPAAGPHSKHPPFLSITAERDITRATAPAFYKTAQELQIPFEAYEYPEMFHCFMMWPTPETQDVLDRTESFLIKCGIIQGTQEEELEGPEGLEGRQGEFLKGYTQDIGDRAGTVSREQQGRQGFWARVLSWLRGH